jgi:hypothetical protein
VSAPIDKRADLPPRFVRQLGKLAREFRGQNLVRRNPPRVKFFYPAKLIRLEARGITDYVLDCACPPFTRSVIPAAET